MKLYNLSFSKVGSQAMHMLMALADLCYYTRHKVSICCKCLDGIMVLRDWSLIMGRGGATKLENRGF